MANKFFVSLLLVIIVVFSGIIIYAADVIPQFNESIDSTLGLNDGINETNASVVVKNITNNTAKINNTANTSANSVIAMQYGPSSSKQGNNVTITWEVKNSLNETIFDVKGLDQNYEYCFGSLAPGESKSVNYSFYIPSVDDLRNAGFGVSEDNNKENLYIGGFSLSYYLDGKVYSINSNEIVIVLE